MRTATVLLIFSFSVSTAAWAGDDLPLDGMSPGGMTGALGDYPANRDSSGTSWQPDTSPLAGRMWMQGEWMTMFEGRVVQVDDRQGGPRGTTKEFAQSMFMLMAQRTRATDSLGFHVMASLDPLMGKDGYPLLLQQGETADGMHTLVDRQHPHDLLMELSATYSHALSEGNAWFAYAGLPGEPALGPPTFMHRFSGMDNPEAPITHHWLDSTHITYGVATLGYVRGPFKIEASAFNGREPDQFRWNIDPVRLDSASMRVSWNPAPDWSAQVSRGYLHSPEQLAPNVNQRRTTASIMYNRSLRETDNWATTVAWGRDDNRPGHVLDAWLAESAYVIADADTFFARAERVHEDELTEGIPALAGQVFTVNKFSLGYIHDWRLSTHVRLGAGGLFSFYSLPQELDSLYGGPHSHMLLVRLSFD